LRSHRDRFIVAPEHFPRFRQSIYYSFVGCRARVIKEPNFIVGK
jgi:hypothetical protein